MMIGSNMVRRKVAIFLLSVTSMHLIFAMTVYYHDNLTIPVPLRAVRFRTGLLPTESSNDTGCLPHLNSSNPADAINRTCMDNKTSANASLNPNIDQRTGITTNKNESEVVDAYIYSKQSLARTALGEGSQAAGEVNGSVSMFGNLTDNAEHRIAATLPIRDLSGYVSVLDLQEQIQMHCSKCAYVSSSGQLLGTNAGALIDSFPCIFRMNGALVQGFEDDVGSKTTVRVMAHSASKYVNSNKKTLLQGVDKPNFLLVWGPSNTMATNGKGTFYNVATSLARELENDTRVFMLNNGQVQYADQTFEKETGLNRVSSKSWLSTGWFTMLFARAVCDEINVFGMVNEDHCRKHLNSKVPYHYFELTTKIFECRFYKSQEGTKASAHRFMTEKSVFARWSRQEPKIIFHHPNWTATEN